MLPERKSVERMLPERKCIGRMLPERKRIERMLPEKKCLEGFEGRRIARKHSPMLFVVRLAVPGNANQLQSDDRIPVNDNGRPLTKKNTTF